MTRSWQIVVAVGMALCLLYPLIWRYLKRGWNQWRANQVGDRVVARKVVTFDSPEEMEAALRKFDRGDVSALLEKRQ